MNCNTFVVIVTFNGVKWIENCLTSVLNSNVPLTVIVVDNGSNDSTLDLVKIKFPKVILLEQKQNFGFGRANNIGIRHAYELGADFFFLLNQDAFVYEDSILNLIEAYKLNPNYGIYSPIQLDGSGQLLEHLFYKFITVDNGRTLFSDLILDRNTSSMYDFDFVQAAAWLLPRKTLEIVGGFDPLFFHYGEDDNYCQRVIYHGLKTGMVVASKVCHDSFKIAKPVPDIYSQNYNKAYILWFKVKFANINISFEEKQIKWEKRKIYKVMIISLLRLRFNYFYGSYLLLKLINITIFEIKNSRLSNKKKGLLHLFD
jgi:GT2 family glycosyltransferase